MLAVELFLATQRGHLQPNLAKQAYYHPHVGSWVPVTTPLCLPHIPRNLKTTRNQIFLMRQDEFLDVEQNISDYVLWDKLQNTY